MSVSPPEAWPVQAVYLFNMNALAPASAQPRPLFDAITPGARVTISTEHGSMLSGRCVMKFPTHAVLNLGGRHGTPGIATRENVHKVAKASVKAVA